MKENVEENVYYDLYEEEEDVARASNPRRSTRRGERAVSVESFYEEVVVEDTDNQEGVAIYSPDQVVSPTIESGDGARRGNGLESTNDIVESYYV